MQDKVCLIMAYKRPQYLARTLHSLSRLHGCDQYDWYIHLDGPREGEEVNTERCLWRSHLASLPNKKIIQQQRNVGMAGAVLYTGWLYDKYKSVITFEEDVVQGFGTLPLLENMAAAFPEAWVAAPPLSDQPLGKLHQLREVRDSCFISRRWTPEHYAVVRPALERYCDIVGPDHKQGREKHLQQIQEEFGTTNPAVDSVCEAVLRSAGVRTLITHRARAHHIGVHGHNNNEHTYARRGWRTDYSIDFQEDLTPYDFEIIDRR